MRKHKSKIILGILIAAILSFAFWYGGNAPGLRGWAPHTEDGVSASQSNVSVLSEFPAPTPEEQNINHIVPISADEDVTEKDSVFQVEKENKNTLVKNGMVIDESTGKDQYHTDPVPEGKPIPVEPQDIVVSDQALSCILSVRCDAILEHIEWLDQNKVEIVPKDGIIYAEQKVVFYDGESVFDVLLREMKQNGIHMEFEQTPMYNSAYIEGIANLYEFDCGELSGWMYRVNGWFPNYGCSRYQLKDGDRIEWIYTCELGAEIGGYFAAVGN